MKDYNINPFELCPPANENPELFVLDLKDTDATPGATLFERLLQLQGIRYERIPKTSKSSLDFRLWSGGAEILAEATDIDVGKDDEAFVRSHWDKEIQRPTIDEPLRIMRSVVGKIPQIEKALADELPKPVLLVLYNGVACAYTAHLFVETALYRRQLAEIGPLLLKPFDANGDIRESLERQRSSIRGLWRRPETKIISALCILDNDMQSEVPARNWMGPPISRIYHNPLALVPMPRGTLQSGPDDFEVWAEAPSYELQYSVEDPSILFTKGF